MDQQTNKTIENKDDALYEEMLKKGRIGFLFSEHRLYNKADIKGRRDGWHSLREYAESINIKGYVKYLMRDVLPRILPAGLIYMDEGDDPNSYMYEGIFVKESDIEFFNQAIQKSREYIFTINNKKSPIEIIYTYRYQKYSIFLDENDYIEGLKYKKKLECLPWPHIGLYWEPQFETIYQDKTDKPNYVYINLPIGQIAIYSYFEMFVIRHAFRSFDAYKEQLRNYYKETEPLGYDMWPISRYDLFLDNSGPGYGHPYEIVYDKYINNGNLNRIVVYENGNYDDNSYRMATIVVTFDDNTVYSKLCIEPYMDLESEGRLYDNDFANIEYDNMDCIRYGFFNNYYCLNYYKQNIFGYATPEAMDVIIVELKKLLCTDRVKKDERIENRVKQMLMNNGQTLGTNIANRMSMHTQY